MNAYLTKPIIAQTLILAVQTITAAKPPMRVVDLHIAP